jgi:hypothetical protein
LDGDGDLDAWVANHHDIPEVSCYNRVWLNDGSGTFIDSGQTPSSCANSVALGDVDDDADLDAWVARSYRRVDGDIGYQSLSNQVWFNDGFGTFSESDQDFVNGGISVALGDLDSDSDLDAWVAKGPNQVWLNDGFGTFSDSGQEFVNGGISVALGDLDSDGDLDAWVANSSEPSRVWLNESDEQESDGNDDGGNGSGGTCLIATAAYGFRMPKEILTIALLFFFMLIVFHKTRVKFKN